MTEARGTESAAFSLAWLLAPVSPADFEREHWEQQPLIVHRNAEAYYDGLFSLGDTDRLLCSSFLPTEVRVVNGGQPAMSTDSGSGRTGTGPSLEDIYAQYRQGATVVLPAIHDRCSSLRGMCQVLGAEMSLKLQINAYLTPANAQGLQGHYDTHDVFVLQIAGTKHWKLGGCPLPLPLKHQTYAREAAPPAASESEFDLRPGDMAYIPRGFLHEAMAQRTGSLHLTVGLLPVTWSDVLLAEIESMIEGDVDYRRSVPPGFARDAGIRAAAEKTVAGLIARLAASLSPERLVANAADIAFAAQSPDLAGHLADLWGAPDIDGTTVVRLRQGLHFEMDSLDPETLGIRFHGKVVRLPRYAERTVQRMAQGLPFSAGNLPRDLDEAGRVRLITRLVEEGFLTLPPTSYDR